MEQPQEQTEGAPRQVRWTSPEIVGEVILLVVVLIFAITYAVELQKLKWSGRYLPLVTIIFAAPFWFIRIKALIDRKRYLQKTGAIMDLGFRFGGDPIAERRRAVQYTAAVATLFIGLWLFGFHIFLPLWVMAYLFIFQKKVNPLIIIMIGAAFEGMLLGVQDFIIDVLWPQPQFFQWIGVDYVFNDWPISDTY